MPCPDSRFLNWKLGWLNGEIRFFFMLKIGVLTFQGGVIEHINATKSAAKALNVECELVPVKYNGQFDSLDGLIIPGGESTTLCKLIEREGVMAEMKLIKNIFGTCAGAIMLAKEVKNGLQDQKTLECMNIGVDRNAYGTQSESFETDIDGELGRIHAVFIRAPKITKIGKNIEILAKYSGEVVACSELTGGKFYLATAFHPELTTTRFHEYFLKMCSR